jgi:hypothetical protein
MPYYRGDYYRGDPGFLSFLGKGVKLVGGLLGIGGGAPSASKIASKVVAALPGAGAMVPAVKATATRVGAVLAKHPTATAAAAAGTVGALGTAGMMGAMHPSVMNALPVGGGMMPGTGAMRGYHISRRTGAMVRNRRMRVTNPRALRRAIRRANGFARLAKRVLHFTSPRAPRGRAVFKKRTRKRV